MARTPGYLLHKPSGQARVRIDGKDHYLGEYGSEDSRQRYDALVARWLISKRSPDALSITINRLCILYIEHCETYYRKNGKVTSEVSTIRLALRELIADCGKLPVADFGPKRLKAVRSRMIAKGWVRESINQQARRINRMLKWGVENELVDASVHANCKAVSGLRRGRSEAVESEPVLPVPDDHIEAVRPHVNRQVWGMIRLQLATGMRPGESRMVRLCDIDRRSDVWEYVPATHKTEHHGRQRRIYIGSRGQQVIHEFLKFDQDEYLFSPADARAEWDAARRAKRESPMTPSQAARKAKAAPNRSAGKCYSKDSYNRAIRRGCEAAEVPIWSPGQLRHNAATLIRRECGLEVARVILGHSSTETTEIYAEQDFAAARNAIAKIG